MYTLALNLINFWCLHTDCVRGPTKPRCCQAKQPCCRGDHACYSGHRRTHCRSVFLLGRGHRMLLPYMSEPHVRHRCSVKIARSLGCRLCRTAAVVVDCRATARMLFPTRRAAVVDLPGVDIATGTENACPIFAYGRLVEIVAGAAVVPASSSGLSGRPWTYAQSMPQPCTDI